jgi:hypothetical protein
MYDFYWNFKNWGLFSQQILTNSINKLNCRKNNHLKMQNSPSDPKKTTGQPRSPQLPDHAELARNLPSAVAVALSLLVAGVIAPRACEKLIEADNAQFAAETAEFREDQAQRTYLEEREAEVAEAQRQENLELRLEEATAMTRSTISTAVNNATAEHSLTPLTESQELDLLRRGEVPPSIFHSVNIGDELNPRSQEQIQRDTERAIQARIEYLSSRERNGTIDQ